ncbi:MAG: hypothetical protein ACRD1R_06100 [Acidobacteriota bacterium]
MKSVALPKRLVDSKDPLVSLKAIQAEATRKGLYKLSMREIDGLIAEVRKAAIRFPSSP